MNSINFINKIFEDQRGRSVVQASRVSESFKVRATVHADFICLLEIVIHVECTYGLRMWFKLPGLTEERAVAVEDVQAEDSLFFLVETGDVIHSKPSHLIAQTSNTTNKTEKRFSMDESCGRRQVGSAVCLFLKCPKWCILKTV